MSYDAYTKRKRISNDDARSVIKNHIDSITKNRQNLTQIISKYGDGVRSRWNRRSQPKRLEILKSAVPASIALQEKWVALTKYYEFEVEVSQAKQIYKTLDDRPKYRAAIMLPILDYPTLSGDSSAFLSLIHNRIEYSPSEWSHLDRQLINFSGNKKMAILLESRSSPQVIGSSPGAWYSLLENSYGQPCDRDDSRVSEGSMLYFGDAEIMFERQSMLYAFIWAAVDKLMQSPPNDEARAEWDKAAAACFMDEDKLSIFSRQEPGICQAAERRICSPPALDYGVLDDVVQLRQDEAQQDLWLLQNGAYCFAPLCP